MPRITADDIREHLLGSLPGDRLRDQETDEVIAVLDLHRPDDVIIAREPDVYPARVLGRWRVTVEEIPDSEIEGIYVMTVRILQPTLPKELTANEVDWSPKIRDALASGETSSRIWHNHEGRFSVTHADLAIEPGPGPAEFTATVLPDHGFHEITYRIGITEQED
jgi:hypothetical protein